MRKRAAFSNVPWYLIPAASRHWSVSRLLTFAALQTRLATTGLHALRQPKRPRPKPCRSNRTMHNTLGLIYALTNRVARGIAECERALAVDRNLVFAHAA